VLNGAGPELCRPVGDAYTALLQRVVRNNATEGVVLADAAALERLATELRG